jgi:hypothetical protein
MHLQLLRGVEILQPADTAGRSLLVAASGLASHLLSSGICKHICAHQLHLHHKHMHQTKRRQSVLCGPGSSTHTMQSRGALHVQATGQLQQAELLMMSCKAPLRLYECLNSLPRTLVAAPTSELLSAVTGAAERRAGVAGAVRTACMMRMLSRCRVDLKARHSSMAEAPATHTRQVTWGLPAAAAMYAMHSSVPAWLAQDDKVVPCSCCTWC